ncbi:MAG: hypothetical protein REI12_03670 [Pedobacter sp.]|nr:hypothetical protein [Pedobacter sp.]
MFPSVRQTTLLLLVSGLLAACAAKPPLPVAVAPVVRPPDVLALAADYQARLGAMSPEALQAEETRLAGTEGLAAVVEQALLLAQRRQGEDLNRALALMDSLSQSTAEGAAPWRPLATMLASGWRADLAEQKRLQEQLALQAQQLRDSQRKNEQLGDKVEQLGHKLEALKSIELNLPKPAGSNPPTSLPNPAPAAVPAPATRSPAS